jgi:hypothetical protein
MTRDAAVAAAMTQTSQPSSTLHWALSGLPEKSQAALGKKIVTATAPAAAAPGPAAPPRCLEGVRRLPSANSGPAEKQAC